MELLHTEKGTNSNLPLKKKSENTWKTIKKDALVDEDKLFVLFKKKKEVFFFFKFLGNYPGGQICQFSTSKTGKSHFLIEIPLCKIIGSPTILYLSVCTWEVIELDPFSFKTVDCSES